MAKRRDQRGQITRKMVLTDLQYADLVAAQGGRCAICGATDDGMCVDHNHDIELDGHGAGVRGALCHHCNRGLGHFRDDPYLLENAAIYLTRQCT